MVDSHDDTTRSKVLALLRTGAPPKAVAELAQQLGVHANTVRFHVDALLRRGQVEEVRTGPNGPGRPAVRFKAVAGMDPTGPRQYRVLAELLIRGITDSPDGTDTAVRAGRAWGRTIAESRQSADPMQGLNDVLDELGFAPQRLAPKQIGLRHCPFLELAESGTVVCSVHLGMMRGLLAGWASGDDVETFDVEALTPFVEPDLCVTHLTTTP